MYYGIQPKLFITSQRMADVNKIKTAQEQIWKTLNDGQGLSLSDIMKMSGMNFEDTMRYVIKPLMEGNLIETRSYYVKKV